MKRIGISFCIILIFGFCLNAQSFITSDAEVQDMLDLMGDAGFNDCNRIVLKEENMHPDFFRLHTGLAGEKLEFWC